MVETFTFKSKFLQQILANIAVFLLNLILCFDSFCPAVLASSSSSVVFKFPKNELELPLEDQARLLEIIEQLKADKYVVVTLRNFIEGIDPTYQAYVVGKTRTLKIFKTFVDAGIDPARITVISKAWSQNWGIKKIIIETHREADRIQETPKILREENSEINEKIPTVHFAKSLAKPIFSSKNTYQDLLKTLSKSAFEAVTIVGYTDEDGSQAFNKVLSELRALEVYELLVRAGLTFSQTELKGVQAQPLPSSLAAERRSKPATRRVEVHAMTEKKQQTEKKVATRDQRAAAGDAAVGPQTVARQGKQEQTKPAPVQKTADAAAKDPADSKTSQAFADLYALAGIYGLGVGKAVWAENGREARVTLFATADTTVSARDELQLGLLNLQFVSLRGDYVQGSGFVRPFIGLGLACYLWDGVLLAPTGELEKLSLRKDWGGFLSLGLDFALTPTLFVGPDFSYHVIGGEFAGDLKSLWVSLRWRI